MKNTTIVLNEADEMLNLILLRDRFESRMDYTTLHALEYHAEKLQEAQMKIVEASLKDDFTNDEVKTMLKYYELKGRKAHDSNKD